MAITIPSPETPVLEGGGTNPELSRQDDGGARRGAGGGAGRGKFAKVWYRFLADLIQRPQEPIAVVVGASTFIYTAQIRGTLIVVGGTVSQVAISRAGTSINTGITEGPFPLAEGDTCNITYTVVPTVTFFGGG